MYYSSNSHFEFPIHPPTIPAPILFAQEERPLSNRRAEDYSMHSNDVSSTSNSVSASCNTWRSKTSSTMTPVSHSSSTPRSSPSRNKEHIVRTSKDRYHTAARVGFLPLLQDASRSDASRESGADRCTPLMCAAGAGHLDALQILAATGFALSDFCSILHCKSHFSRTQ